MLTRIIHYANKVFCLRNELGRVKEAATKCSNRQSSTGLIVGCLMTMALCRVGSFNAMEKNKSKKVWKLLMGCKNKLCSADTLGRRSASITVDSARMLLLNLNRKMRRNKALDPLRTGGYAAVVVDGHEIGCSYLRDFGDTLCLEREMTQKDGSKRTQYYQRLVCAVLVCKGQTQLLDMEMQLPGEGEVAAALRLLERISRDYYHLFDLVMADGLSAQAPFFKAVRKMNKHVIAVLKDERRDLTEDVRLLLPVVKPQAFNRGDNGRIKVLAWDIENQCFNELANKWHADHFYKYDFNAIQVIWLLTMVAHNIFHVFLARNVKINMSASQLADEIKSQFLCLDFDRVGIDCIRIV